jgi:hypothetical protein
MKHAGWVAGATILGSLVFVFEVIRNLHGPGWATGIAEVCISLAWLAFTWKVAHWADKHIAEERKRRESE